MKYVVTIPVAFIIAIIFNVILNFILFILKERKIVRGQLIIDTSSAEKDIYTLELGDHLEDLHNKKRVILEIVKGKISQK